jgi:hypothetical protein
MKGLNYNIHLAINHKSHRKGLVNDQSLTWYMKQAASKVCPDTSFQQLGSSHYPANTYGLYYRVWGKTHSEYPPLTIEGW